MNGYCEDCGCEFRPNSDGLCAACFSSDDESEALGHDDSFQDEIRQRRESSAEEKKAFGRKCKLMSDLLAVHGLPHDFENAKPWVRAFELDGEDPTHEAAGWLEEGWTDINLVEGARGCGCTTPDEAELELEALGWSLDDFEHGGVALAMNVILPEVLGDRLTKQAAFARRESDDD